MGDKKEEKGEEVVVLPSNYTGPLKPGVRYVKLWDAAVIEDGTPEYKREGNKMTFVQNIDSISIIEGTYCLEYNDYEHENGEKADGLITVEAEPVSKELTKYGSRIKYSGKFQLDYKATENEESDEETVQELHLTANTFTLYMTNRWDGMRGWEIVLDPDNSPIKLNLELGYYASILKADADAKALLVNS